MAITDLNIVIPKEQLRFYFDKLVKCDYFNERYTEPFLEVLKDKNIEPTPGNLSKLYVFDTRGQVLNVLNDPSLNVLNRYDYDDYDGIEQIWPYLPEPENEVQSWEEAKEILENEGFEVLNSDKIVVLKYNFDL